jgi:hypothetical protein
MFLLFVAATSIAFGAADKIPETPHLAFVTEYIRELAAIEDIRAAGEQELKQGSQDLTSSDAIYRYAAWYIHNSMAMQLELKSQIHMLKAMRLAAPFEKLIPTITGFYELKIEAHQRLIDINSNFLKPGVDYDGKLLAELPKIRAELEYVDNAILEVTPLVFATLIDQKPDSQNHASHLIISKAERAELVQSLTNCFGTKIDRKGQNFTVSTASVLKAYLLKDFKSSDEPWE